jgi:sugar phosphate permease
MIEPAAKRLRGELTTVLCMYGGYAGLVLCRTTVSIASPEMISDPALGLDEAGFGALLGWGAAGALTGKLLNGVIADRLGGRRLFLLAMFLMGVATVVFGASSAHSLFMLMNFLAQLTKAGAWPAMAKLIGAWFDPGRHGRVWGVVSTSSRASSVISSFLLGALLSVLPWRWLFYVSGMITAVIVGLNFLFLKDSPVQRGLAAPNQELDQGGEPRLGLLAWEQTLGAALNYFAKSRRVQLICLAMMAMTIQMEFVSFLPLYFVQNFAIGAGAAGMASAAFPAGSFISVLAGGLLYDRLTPSGRIRGLGGLLAIGLASIILIRFLPELGLSAPNALGVAVAATFLFGLAVSPAYYIPMSVFSIQFGRTRSGVLIGLIDAFGYGATMIFAPLAGVVIRDQGWPALLTIFVILSVIALSFATAFLIGERHASSLHR